MALNQYVPALFGLHFAATKSIEHKKGAPKNANKISVNLSDGKCICQNWEIGWCKTKMKDFVHKVTNDDTSTN